MSRDIGTIKSTGSRGVDMSLTRYWGGPAGPCIQLTALTEDDEYGYIQLSAADIVALMPHLKSVIDDALHAKRDEAVRAIEQNKELERTIVRDMREVSSMAIAQPVLDYAAVLCLGVREFIEEINNEHD